ncbi:hypothetical protein PO124_22725 [Bacillus licheniformis]|nr:hypothetical protein [Bacillus licheniformis]
MLNRRFAREPSIIDQADYVSRLKETLLNYRSYRLKVNEMSSIDQTDVDSLMAKGGASRKNKLLKPIIRKESTD